MSNIGKRRGTGLSGVAEPRGEDCSRPGSTQTAKQPLTDTTRDPRESQAFIEAITQLLQSRSQNYPKDKVSQEMLTKHRKTLGFLERQPSSRRQNAAYQAHRDCIEKFREHPSDFQNDDSIMKMISSVPGLFENLLAEEHSKFRILHHLFNYDAEDAYDRELTFEELKPLVSFLVRLSPSLLMYPDVQQRRPLFIVIDSAKMGKETKEDLIMYLCKDIQDESVMQNARKSLTMKAKPEDDSDYHCHALHRAIAKDVFIEKDVLKDLDSCLLSPERNIKTKKETKEWFEEQDENGDTPLHLALRQPFSQAKITWAKTLATLKPKVLEIKRNASSENEERLTPLQLLSLEMTRKSSARKDGSSGKSEAKKDESDAKVKDLGDALEELVDFLKHQCLVLCQDDSEAKRIMYNKDEKLQVSLTFDNDDNISGKSLAQLNKHYQLDKILSHVFIPRVSVTWDGPSNESKEKSDKWGCAGRKDLFIVFDWLKTKIKVKKIIDVAVDDLGEEDGGMSHSDHAIEKCLQDLHVEIWDWRRMDIPSHIISSVAGEHVRVVHLYCSGLKAVLQSWSNITGLPQLSKLEEVHLETRQGRESLEVMQRYADEFERELQKNFSLANKSKKPLNVHTKTLPSVPSNTNKAISSGSSDEDGQDARVEEDWLVHMDKFKEFISMVPKPATPRTVKVALIDDGVQASYDGLSDSIENGETWASHQLFSRGKPDRGYRPSYYSSHCNHGTVMAWYIRRVCPDVRLFVAKLDTQKASRQASFSVESATKAINWAIEEDVDIISMSWAIGTVPGEEKKGTEQLQKAIQKAANKNILLFCANPDRGPDDSDPQTLPKCLKDVKRLFCVGAAKNDGQRWEKISPNDKTCDFLLPGVKLGIQFEAQTSSPKQSVPPKEWIEYSGSSLSCALAAGLAGMVLHCAQLGGVGEKEWQWLKSHQGMQTTLKEMHGTEGGWLAVGPVFGQPSLAFAIGETEAKKEFEEHVLPKLFRPWPIRLR